MAEQPAPWDSAFELGTDGPQVIVVGFDGSPTSCRAGAYAAGLARRQGARLVTVHLVAPPVLSVLAPDQLARVATELRADPVVVGASRRAGHRLVGSVGSRLVRTGRWPVIVVP